MTKRNAFTLVETMVAVTLFGGVMVGVLNLYAGSLQFYQKTNADVDITNENASSMRYVTSALRAAMTITISNGGNTIQYAHPATTGVVEPLTGEIELQDPITSDGVARSFTIADGKLTDTVTGKVLLENLATTDPDPDSSQYGKVYAPFQLTTIGSRRAVTITFITQKSAGGENRYTRMKNTVILRNNL